MNKNFTKNLIKEMKQMLDKDKNLTLENVIFSDNEEYNEFDEVDSDYDTNEDEFSKNHSSIENEVKPLIAQIRKMALQGIAQLAEHPECETYSTLKKIWQMVDKATESQNKSQIIEK